MVILPIGLVVGIVAYVLIRTGVLGRRTPPTTPAPPEEPR